jgi:hypothetical protein
MTPPPTQPPLRVMKLAGYLNDLITDVAAQGKVAKIQGNPVEVAAVAVMSGSIAVLEAMWNDIAFLSGVGKERAKEAARPVLAQLASQGAGLLLEKLFRTSK